MLYSERPYSNYADSLVRIIEKNGVICSETIIYHNTLDKCYADYIDPDPLDIKHSTNVLGKLTDYEKITNQNPENLLYYMNETYPLVKNTWIANMGPTQR